MINDIEVIEGVFSFEVTIDESNSPPIYSVTGVLATADKYIEDLRTIQNERYRLEGVRVYKESFGSEENQVVYYFAARKFGIDKSNYVKNKSEVQKINV